MLEHAVFQCVTYSVWAPTNLPHLLTVTTIRQVDLHVDYASEIEPHIGRLIGVGAYGRVFEALWRGQRVAVKHMVCADEAEYKVCTGGGHTTALCCCGVLCFLKHFAHVWLSCLLR